MGTLKPYVMQKSLFEVFTLTGSRDAKTLGMSAHAIAFAIARPWDTWRDFHYFPR